MHCYVCLYQKTLRKSERGAQSALDFAPSWISTSRRHPLVFILSVLAHDVEEAEWSPYCSNSSTQSGEPFSVRAAACLNRPEVPIDGEASWTRF